MSYAIRKDGQGWRAVNSKDECLEGEVFSKEPFPPSPSKEQTQSKINAESRQYLSGTDWYVVRFSETGVPIPDDIKTKRQEARDAII